CYGVPERLRDSHVSGKPCPCPPALAVDAYSVTGPRRLHRKPGGRSPGRTGFPMALPTSGRGMPMALPGTPDNAGGSAFERLRRREFGRLDREGHAYLDYTGSALYATSLVRAHARFLAATVLGNPHSENPASQASTERVERARAHVLTFFRADAAEYAVAFTATARATLKLVGESSPFAEGMALAATADNHNSVNGLRCWARRAGAAVHTIPLTRELRAHDPYDTLRLAPAG